MNRCLKPICLAAAFSVVGSAMAQEYLPYTNPNPGNTGLAGSPDRNGGTLVYENDFPQISNLPACNGLSCFDCGNYFVSEIYPGTLTRTSIGDDITLAGTNRSLVRYEYTVCVNNNAVPTNYDVISELWTATPPVGPFGANFPTFPPVAPIAGTSSTATLLSGGAPGGAGILCYTVNVKPTPGIILPEMLMLVLRSPTQNVPGAAGQFANGSFAVLLDAPELGSSTFAWLRSANGGLPPPPWHTALSGATGVPPFCPDPLGASCTAGCTPEFTLWAKIYAEGTGACCRLGVCTETIAANCQGQFGGEGTTCANFTCSNDECEGKFVLNDGVNPYNVSGATTGPPDSFECNFAFGDPQICLDVWYNYTATCTGLLRVDTCGGATNGDTRLQIYDTCDCSMVGAGTSLDCNDDSGADGDDFDYCNQGGNPPFEAALDAPVVMGNCYKVRVGVYAQGGLCDVGSAGPDELFVACQTCGNGIVEPANGEQCDGGPCCNPDCTYAAGGTVCRASAGSCDVAETCSGQSGACPPDAFLAGGTQCRAANGACDVPESCSGQSPNCPVDGYAAAGTSCRASTGVCDPAEVCTGMGPACPADVLSGAGTVCRGSAGVCDVAENCTGSSGACPADGFAASSVECRASAGVCDVAENCTGTGAACPANGFVAAGQICRPSQGDCDVAEACSGSGADCPANGFQSGNVCRASTGPCDPQETCPGDAANCPSDSTITTCANGDGCCNTAAGCNGDNDNDCPPTAIPTVSEWGLAILALLLLVAGKLYFGRRDEIATA